MVRRLSIGKKQPSDLLQSCDQPSIYCLSTIGYTFVFLLPGKGSQSYLERGRAPGPWQQTLTLFGNVPLPPPPTPVIHSGLYSDNYDDNSNLTQIDDNQSTPKRSVWESSPVRGQHIVNNWLVLIKRGFIALVNDNYVDNNLTCMFGVTIDPKWYLLYNRTGMSVNIEKTTFGNKEHTTD